MLSYMADSKREASFDDESLSSKRPKIEDVDAGTGEIKRESRDTHVSETKKEELAELNNPKEELVTKSDDPNRVSKEILSEVGSSSDRCKSERLDEQVGKLYAIEADAAEDKGARHSMEDAWVVLPDASLEYPGKLRCAHFAIYDGHGGRLAAEYAKTNLHANVLSAGLPRFRRTDVLLLQESAQGSWLDGATAVCVWILGQTVLVANIGDAKAVLARSSSPEGSQNHLDGTDYPLKSIVITREHKAIYPQERARIQKAGGSVGPNGRLQGRLDVSRAFGDRQFKKVGVIATPDVHSFELTEREHFMILGCDGLWGVFGPSDAVEFVRKQLKDKSSATTAARRLVREAVRERRCKDNCTAIVIVFRHNCR